MNLLDALYPEGDNMKKRLRNEWYVDKKRGCNEEEETVTKREKDCYE